VTEPLDDADIKVDLVRSPTRGDRLHPVQLVVFVDYQCPYCAVLEPTLEALQTRYAGKLGVTVKHFPLSSHPQARPAALAAYCAHKQHKFWAMHEQLFAAQDALDSASIDAIAGRIGLDMGAYQECLDDPEASRHIAADQQEGRRAGLQGTPTLLFNGRRYDLSFGTSLESLAHTVDTLLAAPNP
jgi:protein-disulfide isomerase